MTSRDLALSALFAALVVVLGLVPPIALGVIPVPITLQSMGAMLAGTVLGAKRAGLAYVIVLVLVAIGLPVLSGGRGGLAVLMGPTGGYVVGWIAAAFVTGYVAERLVSESAGKWWQLGGFFLASVLGGIAVLYAIGMPWVTVVAGTPLRAVAAGSLAFLPGDILKAAATAIIARTALEAYPLLPRHTRGP
jgi:biotin transport system substrate-specific component